MLMRKIGRIQHSCLFSSTLVAFTALSFLRCNEQRCKLCESLIIYTLAEIKCKNPVLSHLSTPKSLNTKSGSSL